MGQFRMQRANTNITGKLRKRSWWRQGSMEKVQRGVVLSGIANGHTAVASGAAAGFGVVIVNGKTIRKEVRSSTKIQIAQTNKMMAQSSSSWNIYRHTRTQRRPRRSCGAPKVVCHC